MMMNGVDKDGNLYLTYDVSVRHNGKIILCLGTGSSAVIKFYGIAEAGIPGAIKTKCLFSLNVIVTLGGESLLNLIKDHYPDVLEAARRVIEPGERYVIDCYDMS